MVSRKPRSLRTRHGGLKSVEQTEGEVWDILNAGPRNRFTVQGLLVHNCLVLDHCGNWNGFEEDLLEFFRYGPPEELDEGKQKGPLHKRDEEYKGRECECGMLLPARAKMCPACGKEVSRRQGLPDRRRADGGDPGRAGRCRVE